MRQLRLPALALLLAASACHKSAPDSPEYQQAFDLYNQIYTAKLDDAYGDPRIERVLELLGSVDPASLRASDAKELKTRVELGVADFKKRQADVAADQKAALAPVKWTGGGAEAEPAAAPQGPPASGPVLGMARDEFVSKFGDCFGFKGAYEQGDKRGEAYSVKPACAERYPSLVGNLVIVLDQRVSRLVPATDVTERTEGLPAGPAAPAPPVKPPPPPPPPRLAPYQPGAPRPEPAAP